MFYVYKFKGVTAIQKVDTFLSNNKHYVCNQAQPTTAPGPQTPNFHNCYFYTFPLFFLLYLYFFKNTLIGYLGNYMFNFTGWKFAEMNKKNLKCVNNEWKFIKITIMKVSNLKPSSQLRKYFQKLSAVIRLIFCIIINGLPYWQSQLEAFPGHPPLSCPHCSA